MDIGAALAEDQTCYFIIGRQEMLYFGAKTTVQCNNKLKHKIALKFSKKYHCRQKFGQWANNMFFGLPTMKIDP